MNTQTLFTCRDRAVCRYSSSVPIALPGRIFRCGKASSFQSVNPTAQDRGIRDNLYIHINTCKRQAIGCSRIIWYGWVFLQSVSYIKPISTHEKLFDVARSAPNNIFNLIFLGLARPWVGEFVGFILIFTCFPTQQNLGNNWQTP